jgi:flagellar biosynthesis GTPase FlhF
MKRTAVAELEEVSERVKANEDIRKRGMVQRVTLARNILKIRVLLREEEEEKRARKAEKERAAREEAERVSKAREAAIRAAKEAQERAEREAKERFEQQMKERAERLEKERAERDRIRQEKFERQRREDEREKQRFEEHLRKAKETLNNNRGGIDDQTRPQVHQRFDLYIRKWDALKAGVEPEGIEIPPLGFSQIPWPLLFCDAFCPEDITQERIKEFLFHPMHNGEGKTKRSLIRQEMVRWHPDKFNATVLVRVRPEEREAVIEGAGLVARLFNAIRAEL